MSVCVLTGGEEGESLATNTLCTEEKQRGGCGKRYTCVLQVADFGLIKLLQPVREQCPQDDCCCGFDHYDYKSIDSTIY